MAQPELLVDFQREELFLDRLVAKPAPISQMKLQ